MPRLRALAEQPGIGSRLSRPTLQGKGGDGMITVHGPGRCPQCACHIGTQGHRDGCDRTSGTEAAERYRAGLCIACGANKHSAGRPRCNRCHAGRGGWSA
jgi:hypothetical protein